MCPDDRRIKNQDIQIGVAKRLDDGGEPTVLRPPIESPPLAVPIPESFGQIAPRRSRARDPQNRIDKLPIVVGDSAMLSWLAGQQVFDTIPIGI